MPQLSGRGVKRFKAQRFLGQLTKDRVPNSPACPRCGRICATREDCDSSFCIQLPKSAPAVLAIAIRHRHLYCLACPTLVVEYWVEQASQSVVACPPSVPCGNEPPQ